jgi:magnesium chelatase family protein
MWCASSCRPAAAPETPARGRRLGPPAGHARCPTAARYADLADVKGQAAAKRALEIAAAGGHSLLMMGPPGSGKSMLAQRFAGLLPAMSVERGPGKRGRGQPGRRFSLERWAAPHRQPHHTASAVALVGGGSPPRPGEISLAHHGVLFLDELPEFPVPRWKPCASRWKPAHHHCPRGAALGVPGVLSADRRHEPLPLRLTWGRAARPAAARPTRWRATRASSAGRCWIASTCMSRCRLAGQRTAGRPSGRGHRQRARARARARQRALARQGKPNQALQGQEIDTHAGLDPPPCSSCNTAAARLGWSGPRTTAR